ncbi:hypothetical protein NQ317_017862 [Molorchus minor]|uniref:DUF5641 domain-containing protein n=1 Tax=Molorchus minor TaxID=1323400 RepID=A0ABQ9K0S3_9CUCU|nr:hypothetical protein NQ317_017862 [Molorchus minor]
MLLSSIRDKFWPIGGRNLAKKGGTQLEYISELQSRVKWKYTQDKLKEGMLVLVKDKNTHSLCWRLGRVTIVHRGPDGIARVATI